MEDQGSEQDKSEEATPFKLSRARRRGVVARGTDLAFFAILVSALGFLWLGGDVLAACIAGGARLALTAAPGLLGGERAIIAVTGKVMGAVARPVIILAAGTFALILVVELVQTGFVFSASPLKPDFNRMNPANNLKRIFSLRQLIETAKNILKLTAYSAMAYGVFRFAETSLAASLTDATHLAGALRQTALRLLFFFVLAAAAFAVLDQLIVRRDFSKRMRMSRRELKREVKDREGDARMKQRRKKLHGEFSKMSQSVRNIRDADLLIVNPVHFAVALRYDPRTMAAPRVVARGAHQFAGRLKRLAFAYGVTIVEKPDLARALYQHSQLNHQIPDLYYQPVADLYLAMRRRKRALEEQRAVNA